MSSEFDLWSCGLHRERKATDGFGGCFSGLTSLFDAAIVECLAIFEVLRNLGMRGDISVVGFEIFPEYPNALMVVEENLGSNEFPMELVSGFPDERLVLLEP